MNKKWINEPFLIQSATYQYIYEGYDMLGWDITGSGKTLAFTIPLL